jgi:hypothetical protein
MVEYGGAVRQSGDTVGGGGSFDFGSQITDAFGDLVDRIATLPPEMLVLIAAIMMVGGFVFFYRRPA